MPIGEWPNFAACVRDQKAIYRKKNPTWTEEHLDQVARAVCATIEKNAQGATYAPPESGDLPAHGKAILNAAYTACRKEHPEDNDANRTSCSKQAWAAVKNAGYHQDSSGHWLAPSRQGMAIQYQARFEPFMKDERHFIKVFNLEDEVNRNNWGVTPEARERSLRSFMNQKLLGPPGLSNEYVTDPNPKHPHFGTWSVIGKPVDVINNGGTYGIYEVTAPKAWLKIQSKELDAVSPSIHINQAEFQEDGSEIITDFDWDHTLFTPVGAIPKAGVVGTCTASDPSLCGFRAAVQAAFHGHTQTQGDRAELLTDVAGYSTSGNPTENKSEDTPGGVFVKISNPFAQAADAWNTADAPDKFFAIVPDSAKGPDGKKSDRKLPLASVQKKDFDKNIIANALARLPQTDLPSGFTQASVTSTICRAAHSIGYDPPSCQQGQGEAQGERNMPDSEESGCKEAQAKLVNDIAQANAKLKELEGTVQAMRDDTLNAKAGTVVDTLIQAGLVSQDKRAEEVTRHKAFGLPALSDMEARYGLLAKKAQAKPREPHAIRADFGDMLKDPAQAASVQEQVRQAQFNRTRSAEDIARLEAIITAGRPQ